MLERNIQIGCGYQSVAGIGVTPIFDFEALEKSENSNTPPHDKIEKLIVTPRDSMLPLFTFKSLFIESATELSKELSVSLSLSGTVSSVTPELKTSFDKITENNFSSQYYLI